MIDHQSCMLEVLDTAGQEEYTALRDQWIRDGEGFVLVYSITSRSSFTRIQRFHNQIQRVKESSNAGSPTLGGYLSSPIQSPMMMSGVGGGGSNGGGGGGGGGPAPVMLVGNKSDRVTEREVSTQEGNALAKELGCEFVEASAKNCINVERAFYDVVRTLRKQRQDFTRVERRGTTLGGIPGPANHDSLRGPRPRTKHGKEHKSPRCVIL